MVNREKIYAALFEKLKQVEGIVTFSRRLRHWDEVEAYEQPALFLSPVSETVEPRSSQDSRYLMRANVYLYVYAEDAPSERLNECLEYPVADYRSTVFACGGCGVLPHRRPCRTG